MSEMIVQNDQRETRPLLEAAGLTKIYDDGVMALDAVNFSIYPGEIFVMLGANGAGKTTCINIFLNFIEPTEGEARIDGMISHADPLAAKAKAAYVSENVMLYPNFTAIQNLQFFHQLGTGEKPSRDKLHHLLLRVGLQEDAHDKKLKDFSKGMRQKCGIAIAILKGAPAVLLDEPTSGLDPKAGHEFTEMLHRLRNEGRAVLMSTHDIFRAKEIADTIGIMNKGKLVMVKKKAELVNEDLEKLYLHYMAGYNGN